MSEPRILVAAASGQLGRLTIDALLESVPASRIVAGVRNTDGDPAKAFAAKGVEVRKVDYADPNLATALQGIDRLLLISSNDLVSRIGQHRNAIAAAKQAGVKLVIYTSILHADTTPLGLGHDHRQTEAALRESGVPFAVLRNGWYTENYAASIPPALAHGVFIGAAGEGRIASAARADYARAAAAAVLASNEDQNGRIYELAGDDAYTLAAFAAEIAKASGKPVVYDNLSEADFKAALIGAGLPEVFAALLADSDAGASKDALFDASRTLSKLIGRPTTPYAETIAKAVKG